MTTYYFSNGSSTLGRQNPTSGLAQDKNPKGGRAKHVLSTNEIPHAWAHPLEANGSGFYQTHARNPQGNYYFKTASDGTRVLFSYRDSYPIGSLFQVKKGKSVRTVYLYFDGKPYSSTTASHMSGCKGSIPRAHVSFGVEYVVSDSSSHAKPTQAQHVKNVAFLASEYAGTVAKLKKAHSMRTIQWTRETATKQRAQALDYAKFFGVKAPKLEAVPIITAERRAKALAFDAGSEERSRRVREARRARWEAEHKEYLLRQEQERENAKKTLPERIAKWRAGEHASFYSDRLDCAMLRLKGENVETSQGVKVPVSGQAGAARLFRFLKALKDSGRTYTRNGHTQHIGNFAVDSFSPVAVAGIDAEWVAEAMAQGVIKPQEWVMVAGCHRITWSEIEGLAPAVLAAEVQS